MTKIQETTYRLNIDAALALLTDIPAEWTTQLSVRSRDGENLLDGISSINNFGSFEEKDFNKTNQYFKGTVVDDLIQEIEQDGYAVGRMRYMRQMPRTAYSYHMDCEPRIHFALDTTDQAMLIVDDEVLRIPADGRGYWINTTLPHTAVNCATTKRIHLVIDLLTPIRRIDDQHYEIRGRTYNQKEFNAWLLETKPHTEPQRQDFYWV